MKKTASILTCLLFLLTATSVYAQNGGRTLTTNAFGINAAFLNLNTRQGVDKVASNVLRIVNNTSRAQEISIQFSFPAQWSIMGLDVRQLRIEPNDSVFIPVRIIPDKSATGNTSYVINALISVSDVSVANSLWNIAIEKMSDWYAMLPAKRVYFPSDSDSSSFDLRLQNLGNSEEQIVVILTPDPSLMLTDPFGNPIPATSFSYVLRVNSDTTLRFYIRRNTDELLPTDSEFKTKGQKKQYNVKVQARNERVQAGTKAWSGTLEFVKVPDKVKYHAKRYVALPVTIDLNTYDLISDNTYATLDMYGHSVLPGQRTLNYYYQANFNTNEMKLDAFLGQFHYLGYFGKYISLEGGNIGASRSGSNLSGKGGKVGLTLFNNTISALFVRSPNFSEKAILDGMAFTHAFRSRFFSIENFYQRSNQYAIKQQGELATTDIALRITRNHGLQLSGGYSKDLLTANPLNPLSLTGYQYTLRYNGNFRKLRLGAGYSLSSPDYTVLKGMKSLNGNLSYNFSQNYVLSGSFNHFQYRPNIYVGGVLSQVNSFTNRRQYILRLNMYRPNAILILSPQWQEYESAILHVLTRGADFEYRLRGNSSVRFYTNVFAGYTRSLQHSIPDFFVSQVRSTLSYQTFSANIRYFYGPYYSQEQVHYLRTGLNPQKIYANIYHDLWFFDSKALFKSNINYNYTSVYKRSMLAVRPELFYYAKNDLRVSAYGRWILMGEGPVGGSDTIPLLAENYGYNSRLEFGIGIRKEIAIPMTFERFHTVEVLTFRDLNANSTKDNNESGIGNMLIRLQAVTPLADADGIHESEQSYEVMTNSKGKGVFTKVPTGEYLVTAMPVVSTGSWFDGKTLRVMVDKNRVVHVPLNKGARISGGIMIDRDKYSRLLATINLANIRVTATDSAGRTHSTLTDSEGKFSMFLPNGKYEVIMNEAIFGESFQFLQNNISITLSEEFENYSITFYLVERSREVRVKRFDSDGKAIGNDRAPQRRGEGTPPAAPADSSSPVITPAPEIRAPIHDDALLPVGEIVEKGTFYRIQFFTEPAPRKAVGEFANLPAPADVICIVADNSLYFYYSAAFEKERAAGKYLKKLAKAGFTESRIVKFVDGNKVPF